MITTSHLLPEIDYGLRFQGRIDSYPCRPKHNQFMGEVVAQLRECLTNNLLACASMGLNHVKTLNSQCLPWPEEFHQYITAIYPYVGFTNIP